MDDNNRNKGDDMGNMDTDMGRDMYGQQDQKGRKGGKSQKDEDENKEENK